MWPLLIVLSAILIKLFNSKKEVEVEVEVEVEELVVTDIFCHVCLVF
jgi:hypothetical protein